MKAVKHEQSFSILRDHFHVEESPKSEKDIEIWLYQNQIVVNVGVHDGSCQALFTFREFYDALYDLISSQAGSPPSSDDKTPTAATGEGNSGTPEFSVGDRVEFGVSSVENPNRTLILQGLIRKIEGDIAEVMAEGAGVYCRSLSILKNLSRP